jgi:hypothetical protein
MSSSVALLNRLLAIHHRSFSMYLVDAGPWRAETPLDDEAERVFHAMVFDQKGTCRRIAELILERHGALNPGSYPMEFTDKNFLALDYLIGEMLESQRRDLTAMQAILFALPASDTAARELTQEAIGAAKAHIETLETVVAKQVGV